MLNGSKEFCQEFMTDVRIPDTDRIGEVDDGWTVGIRWMFYERSFALSNLLIRPGGSRSHEPAEDANAEPPLVRLARQAGRLDDPIVRDQIGEAHAMGLAQREVTKRIIQGMKTRRFNDQAASMSRLMAGVVARRTNTIAFDIAGPAAVAWSDDDAALGQRGVGFLMRQTSEIAGGTTEMARNVVSERVLGMPRERTLDKDVPFRDVPKGPTGR
jgi:alkylation response protein AidB-like acyl-CoA dehydrogenase